MEIMITDWTTISMDARDHSIAAQVALKAAVDIVANTATSSGSLTDIGDALAFYTDAATDALADSVAKLAERFPAPEPERRPILTAVAGGKAAAGSRTAQDVAASFGGTVESEGDGTWAVRVAGRQHGDLPDWLFAACADKGVGVVFDNRDKLANSPKRPWFVDADNTDTAFWPPKK